MLLILLYSFSEKDCGTESFGSVKYLDGIV
jgi:hypothetical protein